MNKIQKTIQFYRENPRCNIFLAFVVP